MERSIKNDLAQLEEVKKSFVLSLLGRIVPGLMLNWTDLQEYFCTVTNLIVFSFALTE